MAELRGDQTVKDVCREHEIAETLEDARAAIAAYVETYHHRPTRGRTPKEVRTTWEDARESEAPTSHAA